MYRLSPEDVTEYVLRTAYSIRYMTSGRYPGDGFSVWIPITTMSRRGKEREGERGRCGLIFVSSYTTDNKACSTYSAGPGLAGVCPRGKRICQSGTAPVQT